MGKKSFFRWFIVALVSLPLLSACGSSSTPVYNGLGNWTWISGSNIVNGRGVYGLQRATASSNLPGGRQNAVSWTDASGNRWLFGGYGYDSTGAQGLLNDLWKFDGTNWTWVFGSYLINSYGSNILGARSGAVSWIDATGNLWLFGGFGYDSTGTQGVLNDLWKFNTTLNQWTLVSGSNIVNKTGVYGSLGTAAPGNVPGARELAVSWIDGSGNLWLFGGNGYDSNNIVPNFGILNDLWMFNGTNWTWISGSSSANAGGNYGQIGNPAGTNVPGARYGAVSWIDANNNLWLFGGNGYDGSVPTPALGALNDLWKFNLVGPPQQWTWVSGASTIDAIGIYGGYGSGASGNTPGARRYAVSWFNSTTGDLWLFGGDGYDSVNNRGYLNDLWTFNPALSQWTWYNGSATVYAMGNYGTLDIVASTNVAGARGSAVVWFEPATLLNPPTLWLFGGWGVDATGNRGGLNDLWEFQP